MCCSFTKCFIQIRRTFFSENVKICKKWWGRDPPGFSPVRVFRAPRLAGFKRQPAAPGFVTLVETVLSIVKDF